MCSRRHAECAPSIVVQILIRRRVLISALTDPMSDRVQGFHVQRLPLKRQQFSYTVLHFEVNYNLRWLGRRVVSVLDSGAEGLGSNRSRDAIGYHCSHPSCLCSPSSEIGSSPLKGCGGNCRPGRKLWQPTAGFMTHVTCRLTAKNRDQLRNPALGNRVWATFYTFSWRLPLRYVGRYLHRMGSMIYETVLCPSVCLSQHGPTAANPPLQVCCCGPGGGQEESIDCCSSGVRMRAVPRCQRT